MRTKKPAQPTRQPGPRIEPMLQYWKVRAGCRHYTISATYYFTKDTLMSEFLCRQGASVTVSPCHTS